MKEFTTVFKVSQQGLIEKAKTLNDYCASNGKRYKDYKAFLRNAIRKDFGERTPEEIENHKRVQASLAKIRSEQKPQVRVVRDNVTPEQAKANLKKIEQMKKSSGIGKFVR